MLIRSAILALLVAGAIAESAHGQSLNAAQVDSVARVFIPRIERAVGLRFKRPPRLAIRTTAQLRSYMSAKLDQDLPPALLEQVTVAYRLFRLIPDTLDLRALMVSLLTEQVMGFFDPDSSTLYVVDRADPLQLKLVVAHELVHALQDQYVALDSMMSVRKQGDRVRATQAIMEGQATFGSLLAMMPGQDVAQMPDFWNSYRETVRREQQRMPVFSNAPVVVREELIFPYLAGADFARWFSTQFRDTVPFGRRLPVSTEQILHPDHYLSGDRPVDLRFSRGPKPVYDDNLGEFETRVLLTVFSGSETIGSAGALQWGGDRYGVFQVEGSKEYALVWWTVWDTDVAARRFATLLTREWPKQAKAGRKYSVEQSDVDGHPGVRLVDAPPSWKGWQALPSVVTDETLPPGFTTPRALRRTPPPLPQAPKR